MQEDIKWQASENHVLVKNYWATVVNNIGISITNSSNTNTDVVNLLLVLLL